MQDYHLYFPMTLNTNKQLIARANTTIASPTYDIAPSDCEYNGTNAKGQRTVLSKDCGSCVATAFSRAAGDWEHSQAGVQWVAWAQISLVACPIALACTHTRTHSHHSHHSHAQSRHARAAAAATSPSWCWFVPRRR